MAHIYLALAFIGVVVPYIFFTDFFMTAGMQGFIPALFANGAAGGATADLLISSLVFWVWLWQRQTPRMWLYVLINLAIGLSCALPAYLYMDSRGRSGARRAAMAG